MVGSSCSFNTLGYQTAMFRGAGGARTATMEVIVLGEVVVAR
jgi:hypothetical protein